MLDTDKIHAAMELATDVLVGILRRRAAAANMTVEDLVADAQRFTEDTDAVLDNLAAKGHDEPIPVPSEDPA
jgi:hypothetical protein